MVDGFTVSVPGRTEVAGNHEDHQGGCVIAASVDRHMICHVNELQDDLIIVESDGCVPFAIDLNDSNLTTPHMSERYGTRALVRGMVAQLSKHGVHIPGCRLSFTSEIPIGMGLSSSAAFELCCGAALLELAHRVTGTTFQPDPIELAKMAQATEREFFGKPSGLMDQVACELGGVNFIDFRNQENPIIEPIDLPPTWNEYCCILIDCDSGHEDATDDYAKVASDMKDVARFLGVKQLRDVDLSAFLNVFPQIRMTLGDRAALRGYHFFNELQLVTRRLKALQNDDMNSFVRLSDLSGISSAEYLHNVSMPTDNQPAMVALAFCRMALEEAYLAASEELGTAAKRGSARIHGGGFGGTIQVFLPSYERDTFCKRINELFGAERCEELVLGTPGIEIEGSC